MSKVVETISFLVFYYFSNKYLVDLKVGNVGNLKDVIVIHISHLFNCNDGRVSLIFVLIVPRNKKLPLGYKLLMY